MNDVRKIIDETLKVERINEQVDLKELAWQLAILYAKSFLDLDPKDQIREYAEGFVGFNQMSEAKLYEELKDQFQSEDGTPSQEPIDVLYKKLIELNQKG